MSGSYASTAPFSNFGLWKKMEMSNSHPSMWMEITSKCNNDCRHCYINHPDEVSKREEISLEEIKKFADEAASLDCMWCLLTGGEPLLREDFSKIYMYLKRKGFFVSVFTNATLITEEHIALFKKYPPRDLQVSIYGITKETYEWVTGRPGSYEAFMRGLDLLMDGGIRFLPKTVVMRSNLGELMDMARFVREKMGRPLEYEAIIGPRFDGNERRNEIIRGERISPREMALLDDQDARLLHPQEKICNKLFLLRPRADRPDSSFRCGAGRRNFYITATGYLRPCASLCHPAFNYDLRRGSLAEALKVFLPAMLSRKPGGREFQEECNRCPLLKFCDICPSAAYLETGSLDGHVDYLCQVAHARSASRVGRDGKHVA